MPVLPVSACRPADPPDHETIRIDNFPTLEAIGPNRIFVQSTDNPDEFKVDVGQIHKTSIAFTYRLHGEEASLKSQCPLVLKPAWKTGDKLGLLIQYRLNPDAQLAQPVTLHNFVLIATYGGGRATVQTKPASTHVKEKQIVYWRLGDVTLTEDWGKVVCRVVGEAGSEPLPGHVEARWECVPSGPADGAAISISRLEESKGKEKAVEVDPFADGDLASPVPDHRWLDVPLVRRLVSGRYEAR